MRVNIDLPKAYYDKATTAKKKKKDNGQALETYSTGDEKEVKP